MTAKNFLQLYFGLNFLWFSYKTIKESTMDNAGMVFLTINGLMILNSDKLFDPNWWCDAPELWQLKTQDPSSSTMKGILMFTKYLLFIVIFIVVLIGWLYLFYNIRNFNNKYGYNPGKFFHSNSLEIVWIFLLAFFIIKYSIFFVYLIIFYK